AATETLPSSQYMLVGKPEQKKEEEKYIWSPLIYNQRVSKRNKKKDTTEQNNANEMEDEEDGKHSKESLKDQWKALLSQNPEVQELILQLYEQLEINDETTPITWEQVKIVFVLLIKINSKVVFN
ncbi:hypothetical protein RFI_33749, partial [Reticulomyxa filosa]